MLDLQCSIVNGISQEFWNFQLFCMGLSVPLENGLVPCIQGQDIKHRGYLHLWVLQRRYGSILVQML